MQDQHGQGRVLDYMAKTALIAVYAQAGSALSAYPSGVASDKWGRKPLVYMACLGMGGIYLFMGCNKGTPENLAMLLGFFWGVCNGCFVAVDFAIAIDTLPDKNDAARYLGVWGVSAFVGTTLGPITGGLALYFLGALRQARHLPDGSPTCAGSDRFCCGSGAGQIEDGEGGGGPMGEGSMLLYRYSRYGYLGVMVLGAIWNVLACVIVAFVDFERAAALEKKNSSARLKSAAHTELER